MLTFLPCSSFFYDACTRNAASYAFIGVVSVYRAPSGEAAMVGVKLGSRLIGWVHILELEDKDVVVVELCRGEEFEWPARHVRDVDHISGLTEKDMALLKAGWYDSIISAAGCADGDGFLTRLAEGLQSLLETLEIK